MGLVGGLDVSEEVVVDSGYVLGAGVGVRGVMGRFVELREEDFLVED